jgi:hypothetical protein
MRSLLLAVAALAASAVEVSADSEPVPIKARRLAEIGREAHQRGDYGRAIVAFKEAYVLAPSPGLLFNLAQAYRLQGNCDDAALMYRRYIAAARPWGEERALAEGHLATVVRCVQKRNLNLPADQTLASISMPLPGGPDSLLVTKRAPEDRSGGKALRVTGLSVTIGGGVALAAATYFGVRAYRDSEEAERRYAEGASWQEVAPIHQRGERAERTAKWLGIGGGIGAAAGVTLYLLGRRAEHASHVTVAPATGGARVAFSWAF